jgi:RNA polymerase sigma-70 factor (ECF subfamily)
MSDRVENERDAELVERFLAGERAAFDQIVRLHQRGVWYLARRYVRRDADAADVTQQTFVRAYRGLGSYRGSGSLRGWIYRIAIHCSLSWLRDHRREQPQELDEAKRDAIEHPALSQLIDGERATRLRGAIAQLPRKQRLVLELRVFDDLSFKEVADAADCSENTAKVNFHYAVKRLRELLGE